MHIPGVQLVNPLQEINFMVFGTFYMRATFFNLSMKKFHWQRRREQRTRARKKEEQDSLTFHTTQTCTGWLILKLIVEKLYHRK